MSVVLFAREGACAIDCRALGLGGLWSEADMSLTGQQKLEYC